MNLVQAHKLAKAAGFSELTDADAQLYGARIATDILVNKLVLPLVGPDLTVKALGLMAEIVLAQPEMEKQRSPLVVNSRPLRRYFRQSLGPHCKQIFA
jgi:hypothetical protein